MSKAMKPPPTKGYVPVAKKTEGAVKDADAKDAVDPFSNEAIMKR